MKIFSRLFNVAVASILSYFVFQYVYDEYYSYLPAYDKLKSINDNPNLTTVLRDNSIGLRELYNHAFEKSLMYSLVTFVSTIVLLEYIRLGNLITLFLQSLKSDLSTVRGESQDLKGDILSQSRSRSGTPSGEK